ncbi:MAG TPA: calcium/sodium antiporter [Candidatus Tectomicrobia bacterium]|jgi:cation:H+ antiporter
MHNSLTLLLGVIAAGMGGELFVRGSVRLAEWARIPAGIVGATIAAFATSSPEFAVSVSAALAGAPQISLGDALGSNVVNVALILALALLISSMQAPRDSIKRDFPVALLVPVLLAILAFDGMLSRLDGIMLLVVFFTWLTATVLEARRQRSAAEKVLGEPRPGLALLYSLAGLALLVMAAQLIVTGAKGIALSFGLGEFVIGATVVAVGTSIPELATTVISQLRGHQEIGLGTVIGSNIFNGLWIVAVAAILSPITVHWQELIVGLGFGAITMALIFPARDGLIGRWRGALLLALYMVYLSTILTRPVSH